ncbi:MAG: StlD/DarB family beta-ketosynthase [Alphaproteobacteria bacterium]|nr:StlD/DarB family beta-ketosynthase [Alphaproteobacteria bacterium]
MTRHAYITQTAAFLPNAPVGNEDMERVIGQSGDRPSRARRMVLRSNGIVSRHYAIDPDTLKPSHSNAQMTAEAVRALGADLDAVGCMACGTSTPDQLMPNHAVMTQGELKMHAAEVIATSGICLSGATAMKYAWMAVTSGQHDAAVATGSDLATALTQANNFSAESDDKIDALAKRPEIAFEKDFLRWMLSDGAGAVLLEAEPRKDALNLRVDWIDIASHAGDMETCMYAGAVKNDDGTVTSWTRMDRDERDRQSALAIKQDVKLLNEEVIRYTLEKTLQPIVVKRGLKVEDIDHFLPHYSSNFFRDRVKAGLDNVGFPIPQDRWFSNLNQRGNTGAASIYIMIDELIRSGRVERGQRLLCWVPESGRFSAGFIHLTAV